MKNIQKRLQNFCKGDLKFIQKCDKNVYEIVTGYETWLHFYESKQKLKDKIWLTKHKNGLLLLTEEKRLGIFMFCTQLPLILTLLWLRTLTEVQIYYQIKSQKWEGSIFYKILFPRSLQHKHKSFCLKMECRNLMILYSYLPHLSQCDFFLLPKFKKTYLNLRFYPHYTRAQAVYQCLRSIRLLEYKEKKLGKKLECVDYSLLSGIETAVSYQMSPSLKYMYHGHYADFYMCYFMPKIEKSQWYAYHMLVR